MPLCEPQVERLSLIVFRLCSPSSVFVHSTAVARDTDTEWFSLVNLDRSPAAPKATGEVTVRWTPAFK